MNNIEELERALEFPWDKWAVFLHPSQRQLVERDYSGPARVSGSAGTGKTVVALHRAVFLARSNPNARILLTTFSSILANSLRIKLRRLISNEPQLAERLEIYPINEIGIRLFKTNISHPKIVSASKISTLLNKASSEFQQHKFSPNFLISEFEQVVDAWQLTKWEDYRDVKRLGRKTRLPEQQRSILWSIFSKVNEQLQSENLLTYSGMFTKLADFISHNKIIPFEYAIVDESQDISIYHLRFLSALGGKRANALFFAGDLGQRIFQQSFSWKTLGIEVKGRAKSLYVNYRTSHQIRMQSDRLLGPEVSDVDGNTEERGGTVSVLNGPTPTIMTLKTHEEERAVACKWILHLSNQGIKPHEIGVIVRSPNEINRAKHAVEDTGISFIILDEKVDTVSGRISICTMHLAKGFEFRAVIVMACDDEIIPLQERIETITDDADLEEVYNTERHLLYVACTRSRDHLLITSVNPASEFLGDMKLNKT